MKRKISAFACIAALLMAGVTMTSSAPYNASNNNEGTTSVIPEALAEKIICAARDNQFITAEEAMTLSETGAIQQCFDAFVASGYDPSAAIDKLAEISVEAGYFKDVASAKAAMRGAADKARRDESNWAKFYALIGL